MKTQINIPVPPIELLPVFYSLPAAVVWVMVALLAFQVGSNVFWYNVWHSIHNQKTLGDLRYPGA